MFVFPAWLAGQVTTGPAVVSTIFASSAPPVELMPPGEREEPIAIHPPAPPLAVGSKWAASMSVDVFVYVVQTTIGLPEESSAMAGRRESPAVALMPPPCALPANSCQAPLVCWAT